MRQYKYDDAWRLTKQIELNASNNPIATIVDTYDNVGNRTKRNQDGAVSTWTYDDAYRLTGENKAGSFGTYSYDPSGNILVKHDSGESPKTMSYDAASLQAALAPMGNPLPVRDGRQAVRKAPGFDVR